MFSTKLCVMPDWLCPKQVLVCLWGLGTDNALWEMAQQTVSHRRALFGEEKTREQRPGALFYTRELVHGGLGVPVCSGKDPCVQAIYVSSPTQVWRPWSHRHRQVSAFFLEAGWGEWGGRGD